MSPGDLSTRVTEFFQFLNKKLCYLWKISYAFSILGQEKHFFFCCNFNQMQHCLFCGEYLSYLTAYYTNCTACNVLKCKEATAI